MRFPWTKKPLSHLDRLLADVSRARARREALGLDPDPFAVIRPGFVKALAGEGIEVGDPVVFRATPKAALDHEEQIMAMDIFVARYGKARERFEPGDMVMRSHRTNCHGHGWPAAVLEVLEEPMFYHDAECEPSRDMDFGARLDMRIMHVNPEGIVHAHWVESWAFEIYKAPDPPRRNYLTTALKQYAHREATAPGPGKVQVRMINTDAADIFYDMLVADEGQTDEDARVVAKNIPITASEGVSPVVTLEAGQRVLLRASRANRVVVNVETPDLT